VSAPRYFVPRKLDAGERGELGNDQARHFTRVLRRGAGDALTLFNGTGIEAAAKAIEAGPKSVRFEIQSSGRPEREPSLRLTVGLALIKMSGFELALQKLTEVGVARIIPLETQRSVVSYRDVRDWERRAGRLHRIVIEAAEQSERVTIPEISAPTPLVDFMASSSLTVLVERGAGAPIGSVELKPEMAIAVGPEGGWSPDELDVIQNSAGVTTASLGGLIYRAETASIVAAGTLIQRALKHGE
jgi:16S rRNA (uracil1498-N3)-methyltransferase